MLSEMSNHILGSMHDPLKKSTLSSTREVSNAVFHKDKVCIQFYHLN